MEHLFDSAALAIAQAIVNRLHHAGFPGAVVAGGFLRDAALGAPAKDIDVFLPAFDRPLKGNPEAALSGALGVDLRFQCDLSYGEDTEIALILTEVPPSAMPIQVIEMAPGIDPLGRTDRFDFGLCQASVSTAGLRVTKAFLQDIANKTCTLVHCEDATQHARSMRRWERWSTTHPVLKGFTFVDATGFDGGLL